MKKLQQNEQNEKFQKSLEELIDATHFAKAIIFTSELLTKIKFVIYTMMYSIIFSQILILELINVFRFKTKSLGIFRSETSKITLGY